MNAEDFVVNYRGEGQVVEDLSAVPPDVNRSVFSEAFVVKAIDLSDLSGLVVSSYQPYSVWVSHL